MSGPLLFSIIINNHANIIHWQVNTGVVDADPDSATCVIEILEHLQRYVPKNNTGCFMMNIDGMFIEKMIHAWWGRTNARLATDRLDWVMPVSQEFHLDIKLFEVVYLLTRV